MSRRRSSGAKGRGRTTKLSKLIKTPRNGVHPHRGIYNKNSGRSLGL